MGPGPDHGSRQRRSRPNCSDRHAQHQQTRSAYPTPTPDRQPGANASGIPHWFSELVWKYTPEDLRDNLDYLRVVAAGAKAESGWDKNRIQNGYSLGSGQGARGLFQFDMGGMGKPWLGNEQALLGDAGADLQASKIVPLYADAFRRGTQRGLTGADLASFVAGDAEKPAGWTPGAVNWGQPRRTTGRPSTRSRWPARSRPTIRGG